MANVTIKYKDSVIAEMDNTGSKILNTSGTYCESDISVEYEARCRTYDITLANVPKEFVPLVTLDDDVLAHINDERFTAVLRIVDPYVYAGNQRRGVYTSNTPIGLQSEKYPVYGAATYQLGETTVRNDSIYKPANYNVLSAGIGGGALFAIIGDTYYVWADTGFQAGNYQLMFAW